MEALNFDKNNIEDTYGAYSMRLFAILRRVHLAPKGTNVDKLSEVFHFLAMAVDKYAELSPEKDIIKWEIQSIINEKVKASDFYEIWKILQ